MSYHRTAHDVAGAFDRGAQGLAMSLGTVLIEQRMIRQADRQAANAIRAQTARLVYDRVLAEEMAAHRAATARQEQAARAERFRMQRALAALAAKRARG
ncbi:hypothetical protein SAMN04487843_105137 [Methylobacterium sp. ap11]|uniref:hypothetical protein n=1 Tax=Methylobacterium sp. ap11 TaxID=1761799 RepID=UPI0008C30862|nr:hypothetical protein [Methylobacterium sp. ap11]SEO94635.1 hypothetical protein SAMN04487843_105137 [Methylobacterium sp. ap11]